VRGSFQEKIVNVEESSTNPFQGFRELRHGDHLCCIYETEEEHRSILAPFIRHGLQINEKVIYVVDAHTAENILGCLSAEGLKPDEYLPKKQLVILSARDSYLKDGSFDPDAMIGMLRDETETAISEGFSALRVTGEMSWALKDEPGSDRLIEYEIKLNRFFPGNKCLALCQYDRRKFSPKILMDILRTHPTAVIGSRVYDNLYFIPPEDLLGEDPAGKELQGWIETLDNNKKKEEALRTSGERMNTLLSQTPVIIYSYNISANSGISDLTYVSENVKNILGYNSVDFIGSFELLKNYIHPDDWKSLKKALPELAMKLLATGSVTHDDLRFKDKEGNYRWLHDELRLVRYEDGTNEVIGALWDITERKQAEESLKESEERFRLLAENANDVIYILDIKSERYTYVSPSVKTLLGYIADEALSLRPKDILTTQSYEYQFAGLNAALKEPANRRPISNVLELEAIRKGGDKIWVEISARILVDADGQPESVLGVARDITKRRQAEEALRKAEKRFRDFCNDLPAMVCEFLPDATLTYVNKAYCQYFGMTVEELIGRCFLDFIPKESQEGVMKEYLSLAREQPSKVYVHEVDSAGETRWQEWRDSAVFDEQGKIVKYRSVGIDITEQRQAEQELRKINDELRITREGLVQAEKLATVGQLAAGIAHEINNPLASILLNVQQLSHMIKGQARSVANDKILLDVNVCTKALERAERAADRCRKIVTGMLSFAHPARPELRPVDINKLIEQAVEILDARVEAKNVKITKELAGNLPKINADREQLSQVISNLLINACDSMPSGGRLDLKTRLIGHDAETSGGAAGEDIVEIEFSDTGCGIAQEDLGKIFDPFFTTKETGAGTGLGLSISYGIIKGHGGGIDVRSGKGKGTTFIVNLPVRGWNGSKSRKQNKGGAGGEKTG
jgi:PAS domain S-box-containing protein